MFEIKVSFLSLLADITGIKDTTILVYDNIG
jgi:hypothetical protein